MKRREGRTGIGTVIAVAMSAIVSAQAINFKARLSPVPVESNRSGITGQGSVTAALNGRSLDVRGTFEGMKSAATIAQIHLGPRGIRGPVMFDLMVTKRATGAGTLAGTLMLTPEQIEAVKLGRFYVQLHSESAPDGNLWGWLLISTNP